MSGLDFRPTGVEWSGPHSGTVQFGRDDQLLVAFYNRSVHDPVQSQHGKPVHRSIIHVKIQTPGEMLNVVDRPIVEADKIRFRRQWEAFCADRAQIPEGVPIELLFPNYPHVAENLRGYGVYTVEQCAKLSATAIDTIGRGAQEYVNRAKQYLESANKGESFHKLRAENDKLRQDMRVQEFQIQELKRQLEALTHRMTDPVRNSNQPAFIPGYDAQTERINANAPTKELAQQAKKGRRGRKSVEVTPVSEPDLSSTPHEFAPADPLTDPLAHDNIGIRATEGQDAN